MIDGQCGILLDDYNKPRDSQQFFATMIDSFEKCQAQTDYIPDLYPVPRSDFKAYHISGMKLSDGMSNDYPGEIVRFKLRLTPRFGRGR
ncbi:MAG: hypothetical protein EOP62_02440 [Sphingomonadales bacterium]|nr:MAG: hypothetical protein EOP62_02440 [Sphingomonadales bacterium]